MKESPLAKSTKLASNRIAALESARAGLLFAVTHAVRSLNLKRKVDAFWPNAVGSRPQALLEFGVLFHQSFCQ